MSQNRKPEEKKPYVTTYEPIAGWKAVMIWWNDREKDLGGFWEPYETSPIAFATEAEAEQWGRSWAEAEGIRFISRGQNGGA